MAIRGRPQEPFIKWSRVKGAPDLTGGGGGAPSAHAASHQNGGSDELSVAGLSGVLAEPQPPIIGATGTTAVAGNDSRLTDARTPTAHGLVSALHTVSGLTPGHVLTATGPTSVDFQAPAAAGGSEWDAVYTQVADQDVTNSIVLVPSVDLVAPVSAGIWYELLCWIRYASTDATTDMRFRLTLPTLELGSHAVGLFNGLNSSSSFVNQTNIGSTTTWPSADLIMGGATAVTVDLMTKLEVRVKPSVAGNIVFAFANGTAAAGKVSRLFAGSQMLIRAL